MTQATLITIPPSHFCEKARWALDLAGVDYVEQGHAPIFHFAFVYPKTRTRTVPVLLRRGEAPLTDSTDILRWVDTLLPAERRLFPAEHEKEVSALEDEFDRGLGVTTRRLAYCFVASSGPLFTSAFSGGLGRAELLAVQRGERVMRAMLGRVFKVSDRAAARTREKVQATFDQVARLVGDGAHMVGGRFTAADLAFVALAAPVLAPGQSPDRLEEASPAFAALVRHFRETPAGRYAARVRETYRGARFADPPGGA